VLCVVVPLAGRAEVGLASWADGVRDRVVDLGRDGLSAAAGCAAAGRTGADQVLQLPAWDVTVFAMALLTSTLGDWLGGGVQSSQELGELH
jgi:hypothetical protein